MQTFNFNDITEDLAYIFTLCYDNNLNFNRLYTLYKLSSKVFWGYIGALAPIFKMGAKKVSTYSESAHNIIKYFNKIPYTELTEKDKRVYTLMMLFVENIFVTGNLLFVKTQLDFMNKEVLCKYKGKDEYKSLIMHSTTDISDIKEIKIKDTIYYKSSRIETIMNKYYGELKMSEINNLYLKDYEDMITNLQDNKKVVV